MAECIQCGSFTKFEKGLCLPCYNTKGKVIELPSFEDKAGLSDKDRNYRYNMIKGRIAETLI